MPSMPRRRYCNEPGCNTIITDKESYCKSCLREKRIRYDQKRESASDRGYDYRWSKIRRVKLNTDPLCERCSRIAELVHHRDRNQRNNDFDNLESLCVKCHDIEHRKDRFKPKQKERI